MSEEEGKLSKIEEWRIELKKLENHPLILSKGFHICSDGTEVSTKTTARNIKIRMFHLPKEEIDEVLELSNQWRSVFQKKCLLERNIKGRPDKTDWEKAKDRSQEILDLFGKLYSGAEVHKIITLEWGLRNVNYDSVLTFQRKSIDQISVLKEKYKNDTSTVRLVHKRSRLDELTQLYSSRKLRYEKTETKSDYELMLKTLEQIRKEVEGQRITINGQIQVEHELAIQSHVNKEILKNLNINDIIVSRLCARLGVNPKYILYRLHTSYYKKFTGFVPESMGDDDELLYPSQVVYDFQRIKELNTAIDAEDVEYKEEPVVREPKKVENLRELLLKRLEEKKKSLRDQSKNITDITGK